MPALNGAGKTTTDANRGDGRTETDDRTFLPLLRYYITGKITTTTATAAAARTGERTAGTTVCAALPKQTKRSPGRHHRRPSPPPGSVGWGSGGDAIGGTSSDAHVVGEGGVYAPDDDLADRQLTDGLKVQTFRKTTRERSVKR